jgi:hypothetical protein
MPETHWSDESLQCLKTDYALKVTSALASESRRFPSARNRAENRSGMAEKACHPRIASSSVRISRQSNLDGRSGCRCADPSAAAFAKYGRISRRTASPGVLFYIDAKERMVLFFDAHEK